MAKFHQLQNGEMQILREWIGTGINQFQVALCFVGYRSQLWGFLLAIWID